MHRGQACCDLTEKNVCAVRDSVGAGDPEGGGLMTYASHEKINQFYSSSCLGHLS